MNTKYIYSLTINKPNKHDIYKLTIKSKHANLVKLNKFKK